MPIFIKVILIVTATVVIGGTTVGIIKNIQDRRADDNTNTEVVVENTNTDSEQETNTNEPKEETKEETKNTNQEQDTPETNTNTEEEEEEEEEETNTNTVPTTNTNTNEGDTSEPEEEPKETGSCANTDPSGTWRITISEEGASFAPGKVTKTFNFTTSGSANAVETYKDADAEFTANHSGTWTRTGCNISYRGIATGNGTHYESGNFDLKFDVQMQGIINEEGTYFTGSWTSKEVYYNNVIAATDYVTGSMKALK